MSRYDCNKTLDFIHEFHRMCDEYSVSACNDCPLENKLCNPIEEINEEMIAIVQKWSDENEELTRADLFKNIMDNIELKYRLCSTNKMPMTFCNTAVCSECIEYWTEPVK